MSVIIPAHNADPLMGDAINSVFNQSHQNLEIIVVDDRSTSTFFSQRSKARFFRARLEAQDGGGVLSWQEFAARYRPFLRQRYDDCVHAWYRLAGLSVAERDWSKVAVYGSLAAMFGPRYTSKRSVRQRRGLGG